MEEEKKKKRNKKKKNKQNKTIEDAAVGVGETASLDQNYVVEQNHHGQVSETSDVQNSDVEKPNVDLDRHRANGTEGPVLAEADKLYWIQREANLEETIKRLKDEKDLYIQKQDILEETVKQFKNERDSYLQKQAVLEMRVVELQHEKDSCIQKEVNLEEKIKHLEREKDSWVLKETSTKEIIDSLKDDNTRLRIQVMELEESRNKILQENQLLIESISSLQSQTQNLERTSSVHSSTEVTKHASENEVLNSQLEAARSLVEKLSTENAELVEKVNELYVELDRRSMTTGLASAIGSGPMVGTIGTTTVAVPVLDSARMSVSDEKMESLESVPVKDETTGGDSTDTGHTAVIANSLEASESGEIVQISLDENEVQDVESQAAERDDKTDVPLTDAPLIGAPFRFISFVAKYVSGADLVNKSSS
ncbi:hypothetical protein L1049_009087 [Liquidambar formosana]|uniref:Uncharacterized protein n=1 Tax=Liquidambar formosana TaxID=63359 RepID=A0AAP0S7B6_LIQFO